MKKSDKKEKLNNTESKPKKKISKKSIIIYSSIGAPLIAGGIIAGILLGQSHFKVDAYGDLNANDVTEDYSQVYEAFKKAKPENYFTAFDGVELANISLLELTEENDFYTLSTGSVVAAGVKQSINSTYIKNGDKYFEESITESSFVKGANRFYETESSINWHKGKYVSGTSGDYDGAKLTEYSKEDFEETWGKQLSRECIYIVTSQTCLENSVTDNNDGTHTIELELDPTLSVLRYIKQMAMTGGLSQMPVFHKVNLKFTVDDNVKLLKFETYEVYDVHMVIDANNSVGTLEQKFFYKERAIPKIDEPTNYNE